MMQQDRSDDDLVIGERSQSTIECEPVFWRGQPASLRWLSLSSARSRIQRRGQFLGDIVSSEPSRTPGCPFARRTSLTRSGFCAFYIGLMGILMAINVPVISGFRRPGVLVLSAIALAGLTAMLIGRMAKVDESEADASKMGSHPPAANR
jgi:hypothetical protein